MKYRWLNKQQNDILIIFFNGWGLDECVVKHLKSGSNDVLMFYDYNNPETDFDFDTTGNYGETNIVAWSMGVMLCSLFAKKIKNLKTSVAINGTLKPIDADFGIHPKIYDLTIRGFDEKGRDKFLKNMFETEIALNCNRELAGQKTELVAIRNYTADESFQYNKILISENDKIIPTKNQCKFWNTKPNLKGGHCPFFGFEKWSELL